MALLQRRQLGHVFGGIRASRLRQNPDKIGVGREVIRICVHGFFPLLDGFFLLADLQKVAAKIKPRLSVIGLQIHDPLKQFGGVRRRMLHDSEQEQSTHVVWGETDGFAKLVPCLVLAA